MKKVEKEEFIMSVNNVVHRRMLLSCGCTLVRRVTKPSYIEDNEKLLNWCRAGILSFPRMKKCQNCDQ